MLSWRPVTIGLHLILLACVSRWGAEAKRGGSVMGGLAMDSKQPSRVLQQVTGRIAFASKANCGRYPYMVSLRDRENKHRCGGVLVHPRWVLTSARCVDPKDNASLKGQAVIIIGVCNLDDVLAEKNQANGTVEAFLTQRTFVHENWTGLLEDGHDIALLLIDGRSKSIPVQMALPEKLSSSTDRVVALGWGKDQTGRMVSDLQQATDVEVIQNRFCDDKDYWPLLKESMICAFGIASNQNLCEGDLGGPLLEVFAPSGNVARGSAKFDLLVGIASFVEEGVKCGLSKRPGVFTRMSSFREWADEKIMKFTDEMDEPLRITPLVDDSTAEAEAPEDDDTAEEPGMDSTPMADGSSDSDGGNAKGKNESSAGIESSNMQNENKRDRCSFCLTDNICFNCKDEVNDGN